MKIIAFSDHPSEFPPASSLKLSPAFLKALVLADRRRREEEEKQREQDVSAMEKPSKVVYMNHGLTKITLIGTDFFRTPEEISRDYERRLEEGCPRTRQLNDVMFDILERTVVIKR